MSTVTVVPTVDMANSPPRVRLDVTDVGTSPAITSTTVTRTDANGDTVPVRTLDGNPLALSTSGANRVGFLYDYEMPYGLACTYSTVESPTVISAPVTVNETRVWLIHPGVPSLSQPIELRAGSFAEETWQAKQGVLYPMNRDTPVVISDGRRKAPTSSLTVWVDTLSEIAAMRDLVADAGVLMLNFPAGMGWGIDSCYIAVQDVSLRRPSDIGADPQREVVMPYLQVARPAGGSQSQRTLADLLSYTSLANLRAAYPTLLALATGP